MFKTKDYLTRKKQVIEYFKKKEVNRENIGEYCQFSFIPIIVVCVFIKEEIPEHSDLMDEILLDFKNFYGE